MASQAQIDALVSAMEQLLDDMGTGRGTNVCMAAKAAARIAFEPFREADADFYMPLDEAQRIVTMIARPEV